MMFLFFLKVYVDLKCFDLSKGQSTLVKLQPKKNHEFELNIYGYLIISTLEIISCISLKYVCCFLG